MSHDSTFWSRMYDYMVVFCEIFTAINIGGAILMGFGRVRRKLTTPPSFEDLVKLTCPVEGCIYQKGHDAPCWDGTPDPNKAAQS
jgi:hypothetical protein